MTLEVRLSAFAGRVADEFVAVRGELPYVSVKQFGATGDGSTNDTSALQSAINATPAGGVCWLPPGVYRTSSSLVVPPQVTLQGAHAVSLTYATGPANPCVIKPVAAGSWSGHAAVIRALNKTTGSYGSDSVGQRIRHLTIDGSANTTSGMVGVELYGYVREVVCDQVTVRNVTSDGFTTISFSPFTGDSAAPASCRFLDCVADNCGGAGFVISGPDCYLSGCNAQGSGYCGFITQYAPNTQMVGCRAEWSTNHNYLLTGDFGSGQGAGAVMMAGCSSDRANFNGILVNSTGTGTHNITGFSSRRDGRNGGSGGGNYAGIQVTGAGSPVVVDGLTVYPGVNDDGTGTNSPQYGVRAGTSTYVQVASGYIHAATAPSSDAGGNTYFSVWPSVGTATGTTGSPTRTAPAAPLSQLGPVTTKTADYTLTDADGVVIFDTTSAACTATLPTAVGRAGRRFLIKKLGPVIDNLVTVTTTGSELIDGVNTLPPLLIGTQAIEVISDGTNWHTIGQASKAFAAVWNSPSNGGTLTIDAAVGTVARCVPGGTVSSFTLAAPINPVDTQAVNLEVKPTITCSMSLGSGLVNVSGATFPFSIPAGKKAFFGLRYSSSAWYLLAAGVEP